MTVHVFVRNTGIVQHTPQAALRVGTLEAHHEPEDSNPTDGVEERRADNMKAPCTTANTQICFNQIRNKSTTCGISRNNWNVYIHKNAKI